MNFDDRLKTHLHDQSQAMVVAGEGAGAVRARSRQRRQRRSAIAIVSVTVAIAIAAITFVGQGQDQTQLATTDENTAPSSSSVVEVPVTDRTTTTTSPPRVRPQPGTPLSLRTASTNNAPGGYNLLQSGRVGDVYFVVSTAPGVTYEDAAFEDLYPSSIYTFDGSLWSETKIGDRFTSHFDSSTQGLLYAVSTGTPTSQELTVGHSSDAASWDWTPIDLRSVFGENPNDWPVYQPWLAIDGERQFLVVSTGGDIDYEIGFDLARNAGADIHTVDQIAGITRDSISWYVANDRTADCMAEETRVTRDLDETYLGGPTWLDEEVVEVTDEQAAEIDEMYLLFNQELEQWYEESGCGEILTAYRDDLELAEVTWAELGVVVPDSWMATYYGFEIVGDSVREVGELFDGEAGYLAEVTFENHAWTAIFAETPYTPEEPAYMKWTSSDLIEWSTAPTTWSYPPESHALSDGTSFTMSWSETGRQLLRQNADRSTNTLELSDLAPELDTEGYDLTTVSTGDYGVVVAAVNFNALRAGGNYESIVFYSPDGKEWGATEVPGREVVAAIVGTTDVLIFLNDPNREPGTPQPILLGT